MLTSTKKHSKYWEDRKIDWEKSYLATWEHPHRGAITAVLRTLPFFSLWEIGCGAGANLYRITKEIPGKQLGGSDINADAIEVCEKTFKGGMFHVESGEDLFMSDKSVDILLYDMCLIYVGPRKIRQYLKEAKRVGRNNIVLCEFHSESWWKRLKARIFSGYHVYNYKKLLNELGFYDIKTFHLDEQYWPGADNNSEFRTLITAQI